MATTKYFVARECFFVPCSNGFERSVEHSAYSVLQVTMPGIVLGFS